MAPKEQEPEPYDPKFAKRKLLVNLICLMTEMQLAVVKARRAASKYHGGSPNDRVFDRLSVFLKHLDDAIKEQYGVMLEEW